MDQIALAKRADKVYPVPGPWINGGVIKSLANIVAGTKPPGSQDCEDNDGLSLVRCFNCNWARKVSSADTECWRKYR